MINCAANPADRTQELDEHVKSTLLQKLRQHTKPSTPAYLVLAWFRRIVSCLSLDAKIII
jgi:hypothetical protein